MADIHLTRELLWAVSRGELPPSVITQLGLEHLMSLCRTCRKEITAFQKEQKAATGGDYSRAFQILPSLIEEQIPRMEQEQRGADTASRARSQSVPERHARSAPREGEPEAGS